MAQLSTSSAPWKGKDVYLQMFIRKNYEKGWEEISDLLALHHDRPVRFCYVAQNATPRVRRYEGTVCATCTYGPRGYAYVARIVVNHPIRCFMQAPKKVDPLSKNTHCVVCHNHAFPELLKERPNR